jgi:hypothetical protein
MRLAARPVGAHSRRVVPEDAQDGFDDGGLADAGPAGQEILAGAVTGVEQIAAREKCSIRKIHMTISLAFLAPDLVKTVIEGRLPRGIGVARLCGAPAKWSRQYRMLALPKHSPSSA